MNNNKYFINENATKAAFEIGSDELISSLTNAISKVAWLDKRYLEEVNYRNGGSESLTIKAVESHDAYGRELLDCIERVRRALILFGVSVKETTETDEPVVPYLPKEDIEGILLTEKAFLLFISKYFEGVTGHIDAILEDIDELRAEFKRLHELDNKED